MGLSILSENKTHLIHQRILKQVLNTSNVKILSTNHVAGGCINETIYCKTSSGSYFIKTNSNPPHDLFEKEKEGLKLLGELSPVRSPKIIGEGKVDHINYLVEEWIEKGPPNSSSWESFGENLAKQHQVNNKNFGLDHDNHIGRLHQSNTQHNNWIDFFVEERIKPQLSLALNSLLIDKNLIEKFEKFFLKLSDLIPNEPASLLHGDLWSGNFMFDSDGKAVIFDPAVYYGHREMELAFTTMFGGFDQRFYDTYLEKYPLTPGFENRIEIHNLYPTLVHVNLFGTSYLSGILSTIKRFS